MGNVFSLHTWELNFGQTTRGKIEVLLGTIWELGEPFWEPDDNRLRMHGEKGQNPKNWSPHEAMLSLLLRCMKLLFPKLSVTIFGLG